MNNRKDPFPCWFKKEAWRREREFNKWKVTDRSVSFEEWYELNKKKDE